MCVCVRAELVLYTVSYSVWRRIVCFFKSRYEKERVERREERGRPGKERGEEGGGEGRGGRRERRLKGGWRRM